VWIPRESLPEAGLALDDDYIHTVPQFRVRRTFHKEVRLLSSVFDKLGMDRRLHEMETSCHLHWAQSVVVFCHLAENHSSGLVSESSSSDPVFQPLQMLTC
jgi:hypothetical protein